MEAELQKKILEKYPLLYSDKDKPMTETCMCWGLDCGDGWYDLINDLSTKLEKLIEQWIEDNPNDKDNHPRAAQVKEKFGGLRFYMTSGVEEMRGLIKKAEDDSCTICEFCGQPGTVRRRGWIITLCDECEEKRKEVQSK